MPILLGYIYIQGETQKKKIHIFTAKFLSSTTFLYRKFNTNGFLLMGRYRWFLVGWSVCGCLPLYINTWWSDVSPLHPCMHTYSEGELDSLVSVTLGKPWFVTDRQLKHFGNFISPNPLVTTESPPKGHQLSMIKSRSNEFFDSSVEKKNFVKSVMQCFPDF